MLLAIGGQSGSGKSTSIRNLDPKETFIIQTIPKPLPFPKWKTNYPLLDKKTFTGNRYVVFDRGFDDNGDSNKKQYVNSATRIVNILKRVANERKEIKQIIIDDLQYVMAYEIMARGNEIGYDKYSSVANNFFNIMKQASAISDDLDVVVLQHVEVSDGITKLKTVGKMFDNQITEEGLFTVVLMTVLTKKDGKVDYQFATHTDGSSTAKSPMGLFSADFIPNDLVEVFKAIKAYE